jgi:hypothetical protein
MKKKANTYIDILIGTILVATLALAGCAGTEKPSEKMAPTLSISGSGIPGKPFDVAGSGFVPGEVIELVLNMESVPIIVGKKGRTIQAGQDGTFAAKTNYPHKYVAIPGSWNLVAIGDKGTEAVCKVQIKKP